MNVGWLSLCGFVVLVIAGLVAVVLYVRQHPEVTENFFTVGSGGAQKVSSGLPTDQLQQDLTATTDEMLFAIEPSQTVKFVAGPELTVRAKVTLTPMEQRSKGSPWTPKSGRSVAVLASDEWLVNVPRREGSPAVWLRMKPVDGDWSGLRAFFKGTDSSPGPARKFSRGDQVTPVSYRFPGGMGIFPGVGWQVVDVGGFTCGVSGKTSGALYSRDFVMFVTSRGVGKDGQWLLFLDPRNDLPGYENTRGVGLFLVGEEFSPEEDIQEII